MMNNQDLKDIYDAGVIAERERILGLIRKSAADRSILEALAYPYLAGELEEMILEGQDD